MPLLLDLVPNDIVVLIYYDIHRYYISILNGSYRQATQADNTICFNDSDYVDFILFYYHVSKNTQPISQALCQRIHMNYRPLESTIYYNYDDQEDDDLMYINIYRISDAKEPPRASLPKRYVFSSGLKCEGAYW